MYPSFPSITFPNHWTLVTGLYPEAHGIVANEFYDPLLQAGFIHKEPEISLQPRWWGGEPIWATSTLQGKRSGVIMWPGAAVPIHSANADYFIDYDRSMTAVDKMDMALKWLDLPIDRRPEVVSVYIPQIDQKGHGGGPNGPQMNMVLSNMDSAVDHLLKGLDERNLGPHVHVVIVSDHGMAATHSSQLIYYDDIIPHNLLPYLEREAWPLLSLRPVEGAPLDIIEIVYEALYLYTQSVDEPHFQVYLRQDVPERFHYNSTERIAPIVTIPDPGYSFVTHKDFDPSLGKEYRPRGMHGYDNMAVEMRAIFMARGPTVESEYEPGMVLAPFQNIEVYEFITHIMDLKPAPNNGTLHGILKAA
ncbi:alkaline-phosphatase-like protein [Phycomyces nitens]|nr:alkaline-phosphatase-like protein [Phycomyces nitens]